METVAIGNMTPLNELFGSLFENPKFDRDYYETNYGGANATNPKAFLALFGDTRVIHQECTKGNVCGPSPFGELLIFKIWELERDGQSEKAAELRNAIVKYASNILSSIHEWDETTGKAGKSYYGEMGFNTLITELIRRMRIDDLVEPMNRFYEQQSTRSMELTPYTFLGEALAMHQKDDSLKRLWNDVLEGKLNPRTLAPLKKRYCYPPSQSQYAEWCNAERYEIAVLGVGMQRVDFDTLKKDLIEILEKADAEFKDDIERKRLEPESLCIIEPPDNESKKMGLQLRRDQKIEMSFQRILERDDLTPEQKRDLESLFNLNQV